jgi:galactokinase
MTGERLAAQLTQHGLDALEDARKRSLWDLALQHFSRVAGGDPASALWVPGRIEVFGKHTDYGGGHSLVGPVPRGFAFVARRRDDRIVSMTDAVRGDSFSIDLGPSAVALPPSRFGLQRAEALPAPGSQPETTGWRRYAATTVHRLQRNFPGAAIGADIVFASDLPPSSGMSSSSALMVGLAATLVRLGDIDARPDWRAAIATPADAAGYYACIENGLSFGGLTGDAGVGTHGGSEDHVALTCGRAGHVSAWRFVPIQHLAEVAVPAGWKFVIASSGVAAKKTGGARDAYNRLSSLAGALLDLWNGAEPPARSLHAALATSAAAPERLATLVRNRRPFDQAQGRPFDQAQGRPAGPSAADLLDRLTHFLNEDARIPAAVDALRAADRARIGTLSDDSQSDAEALLHNQVPETIALAHAARTLGAFGASSFGAGFGGSVWALVETADAVDFAARWLSDYRTRFPARDTSTVFVAPLGPSLTWLR